MFQMGFGESILLHDNESCLLVDCGSESSDRLKYFKSVAGTIEHYNNRSLLITHFHSDHMNGIKYLSNDFRNYFDNIYLPHIFTTDDKTLDLLIAEYLLESLLDKRRKDPKIWECLIAMANAECQFSLLGCGNQFNCVGHDFRVLWPSAGNIQSIEWWSKLKENEQILQLEYEKIEKLSNETKLVVRAMSREEDGQIVPSDAVMQFENLHSRYVELRDSYREDMFAEGILFNESKIRDEYRNIKDKNETSIVFKTIDDCYPRILMTGDITPKIMDEIVKLDNATLSEKEHFDIIKAPHHGTLNSYFDFSQFYDFDTLYISNGETTWSEKRRGKISSNYFLQMYSQKILCSKTPQCRCEFAHKNGQCAHCCK